MVEPRGVEPLSEDQKTRASPSAVCVLEFPPPNSRRQDYGLGSFIKSRRSQSFGRLVPCYYDVDGLRGRTLRVDDRRLGGDGYVIVVVSYFLFPFLGGSGPPLASLSLRIPVETKIRPHVGSEPLTRSFDPFSNFARAESARYRAWRRAWPCRRACRTASCPCTAPAPASCARPSGTRSAGSAPAPAA